MNCHSKTYSILTYQINEIFFMIVSYIIEIILPIIFHGIYLELRNVSCICKRFCMVTAWIVEYVKVN